MNAPTRFVVCSLEPWDEIWRRNQYLLDQLMTSDDSLEVLLVEPVADPLHALTHGRRPRAGSGLRTLPGYGGRLRALQPTKLGVRSAGSAVQAHLDGQVVRAVRELGWERPLLWINDPLWSSLLSTGWPSFYDITDDWVAAHRSARAHARIAEADARLLAEADAVVVCSPALQERKGGVLVRNGVDVDAYRRDTARPDDLPAGPVAVYVGTLHEDRLDVDLAVETAARLGHDGATLVLVGPDALSPAASARLHDASGLVMAGSKPAERVPAYLQHADVLVVPHVVDAFTDSLDPIKLYEYLATGRPVVSTPVAGFRDCADAPGFCVTPADSFPGEVAAAVAPRHPNVHHHGVPTWSDRAAQLRDVIQQIDAEVTL